MFIKEGNFGIICKEGADFVCVYGQDGLIFIFNKPINKTFHLGDIVTYTTLSSEGFIIPSQQDIALLKESNISIKIDNRSYSKFYISSKIHTCFNRYASEKETILFENSIQNKESVKIDFTEFHDKYCQYSSYTIVR